MYLEPFVCVHQQPFSIPKERASLCPKGVSPIVGRDPAWLKMRVRTQATKTGLCLQTKKTSHTNWFSSPAIPRQLRSSQYSLLQHSTCFTSKGYMAHSGTYSCACTPFASYPTISALVYASYLSPTCSCFPKCSPGPRNTRMCS